MTSLWVTCVATLTKAMSYLISNVSFKDSLIVSRGYSSRRLFKWAVELENNL